MGVDKSITQIDSGLSLARQIDEVLDSFRPFKPEVKRIRIDYRVRDAEINYLLNIPEGLKRTTHGRVELPATRGFRIAEVWDMDAIQPLKPIIIGGGDKWIFDASKFPSSEKYMVAVKGKVSTDFLGRLVSVNCAVNPTKRDDDDCYWIHSALKDVSIFKRIWDELDIDNVNMDVRIGVERFFTAAIPDEITGKMKTQRKLLTAIGQGRRNIEILKMEYRKASSKVSISPSDLYEFLLSLASGDFFSNYVAVDDPFLIGNIEPEKRITALIPEKVKIGVLTDLNFESPAAKGELIFEKKKYEEGVQEALDELM